MAVPEITYPLRIGVQLHPQNTSYRGLVEALLRVEDMGVDSIWTWDHFFPSFYGDPQADHFEGWTLLSAMAALTRRAQIGCLVTCTSYRNPALLSNMAKTVDHISNGRLILGMGAGWLERDYKEYGYDFGTPGSRLAALEESLIIIRQRWEVDVPKPIRNPIPIVIGGGGEKKTLRITAQYADMWHCFEDAKTLTHKMQVLDQWCAEIGRNPREIERSCTVRIQDTDSARRPYIEDTLDSYVKAGATHIIFGMKSPWDFDMLQTLVRWRDKRRAGN